MGCRNLCFTGWYMWKQSNTWHTEMGVCVRGCLPENGWSLKVWCWQEYRDLTDLSSDYPINPRPCGTITNISGYNSSSNELKLKLCRVWQSVKLRKEQVSTSCVCCSAGPGSRPRHLEGFHTSAAQWQRRAGLPSATHLKSCLPLSEVG